MRYEIHAKRQVPNAGDHLASVARMEGISIVSKTRTGLIADMAAPLAARLAQSYGASLTVQAV